jgi:hypothetical protein
MTSDNRESDRRRLHELLERLAARQGGLRRLAECHGRLSWPSHGVYFFYEDGETGAGGRPRVVRVGTHALTATSRSSLWDRLSQHQGNAGGQNRGGGNHRGSIFRQHVGTALIRREGLPDDLLASWLAAKPPESHPGERGIEREVSRVIGLMPFTWLAVPTMADGTSVRADIERNAIALLADTPSSPGWLGRHASHATIRESGLWNVNHVNEPYNPRFLDRLEQLACAGPDDPAASTTAVQAEQRSRVTPPSSP